MKIIGRNYHKYLSECLESVPTFLGGDCSCSKCSNNCTTEHPDVEEFDSVLPSSNSTELEYAPPAAAAAANTREDWERLKRVTLVGCLLFCIFIMFMRGVLHRDKVLHLYSKFTVG